MELHTWGDSAPCKGHKLTKPPIPSIGNFPSHCYQQFQEIPQIIKVIAIVLDGPQKHTTNTGLGGSELDMTWKLSSPRITSHNY